MKGSIHLVVTVTVDGDYFFDANDLVRHVDEWIRDGLHDRDDIDAYGDGLRIKQVGEQMWHEADVRAAVVAAVTSPEPRYGGPQHDNPDGLSLTASAEELRAYRARKLADQVMTKLRKGAQ